VEKFMKIFNAIVVSFADFVLHYASNGQRPEE